MTYTLIARTTCFLILSGWLSCAVAGPSPARPESLTLATGYFHTVVLREDNSLWGWGNNSFGQLGHPPVISINSPRPIGQDKDWAAVSAGYAHTVAIKQDGSLWAWGKNSNGQLGDGTTESRSTPTRMTSSQDWASVSAGYSHTLALKKDGSLWAWGNNEEWQLGNGSTSQLAPVRIGSENDWAEISAGINYSLGIKRDGSLWGWGSSILFDHLADRHSVHRVPVQLGTDKFWAKVSAGTIHALLLKQDGTLWGWGSNGYGQVGVDSSGYRVDTPRQIGGNSQYLMVRALRNFSLAIKADGTLWVWGNSYDRPGYHPENWQPRQVDGLWRNAGLGFGFGIGIKSSGELVSWGTNYSGQLGRGIASRQGVPTNSNAYFAKVAAGSGSAFGIKADGTLWGWGDNLAGQLGLGDQTVRNRPVQIGTNNDWLDVSTAESNWQRDNSHTLAIKQDGSLWAWGSNQWGQLGLAPERSKPCSVIDRPCELRPIKISDSHDWLRVSA
ncbi:RCC1-like domain-containing protein, partial [Parachitinimonas caeni]